jgi:hypothetical protein
LEPSPETAAQHAAALADVAGSTAALLNHVNAQDFFTEQGCKLELVKLTETYCEISLFMPETLRSEESPNVADVAKDMREHGSYEDWVARILNDENPNAAEMAERLTDDRDKNYEVLAEILIGSMASSGPSYEDLAELWSKNIEGHAFGWLFNNVWYLYDDTVRTIVVSAYGRGGVAGKPIYVYESKYPRSN